MRLQDLKPEHVRKAVSIYMSIAWRGVAEPKPRFDPQSLEGLTRLDDVFALCDRPDEAEEPHSARYTMRLGNARYPFMKFVVQEYLVDSEYFFSVDTHDDHIMRPGDPEWDQWCELKVYNRELKSLIEDAWEKAELPTHADLRTLAVGLAQVEREDEKRARLLVVDDEKDVCQGLGALLEARGYMIDLAYNGQEVLDRLAEDPLPDLIILDFSMPELDGVQVLRRIRERERTRDIPVLMATASSIDLKNIERANGLLRKPYPRELLIGMVKRLLVGGAV